MIGKYEMLVEKDKKVFRAYAEGFFTMEDGENFVKDFIQKSKGLSDYNLIVDGKGVKPSNPEVADALKNALKLYIQTPFKARYIVKQDSAVGIMQSRRLVKSVTKDLGVDENVIQYVESKEDAYSKIG